MGKNSRSARRRAARAAALATSKRSFPRWLRGLLAIGLLAGAAIFIVRSSHEETPIPDETRPDQPQFPGLVRTNSGFYIPAPDRSAQHRFMGVARLPRTTMAQVREALDLIAELDGAPDLKTSRDQAIMRLARSYRDGSRPFNIDPLAITIGGGEYPVVGRMAYACKLDRYAFDPNIQATTAGLAVSLYHELDHAVTCLGSKEAGTFDAEAERAAYQANPCAAEASPWAAQIRFTFALHETGRLPTEISAEENSEAGMLDATVEAWRAFVEDRFCDWYREKVEIGTQRTRPINIRPMSD